jgi:SHS2 domain-containing protein
LPYRFVEDAPTADIGFVASGATLEECFAAAADAMLGAMLNNPDSLRPQEQLALAVEADSVELALVKMLEEIVFYKDARGLFLAAGNLRVKHLEPAGRWTVTGTLRGEPIDPSRHELAHDVKAVTMHRLRVRQTENGWEASVVLDV